MRGTKDFKAGFAASVAVHFVILFCILRLAPASVEDTSTPPISVTIVPEFSPGQDAGKPDTTPDTPPPTERSPASPSSAGEAASLPPPAPVENPPPPPSPPPPAQHSDQAPKMVEASTLYAAAILARPENRSARDALKTLSAAERNEQICDTEAMEQIRRFDARFRPDRLVAYALGNTNMDGDRLQAPGAAFRSAHRWFRLSFDCTLDQRRQAVSAFRFAIGAPIPSDQWNDLQLER